MVGVLGRLTQPIRAGGIGELVYTQGGTRRSCGARSADGAAIAKGPEAVVTEKGGGSRGGGRARAVGGRLVLARGVQHRGAGGADLLAPPRRLSQMGEQAMSVQ